MPKNQVLSQECLILVQLFDEMFPKMDRVMLFTKSMRSITRDLSDPFGFAVCSNRVCRSLERFVDK